MIALATYFPKTFARVAETEKVVEERHLRDDQLRV